MRQFLAVMFASLAAALSPALAITCWFFAFDNHSQNPIWPLVFLVAFAVSATHTLLFGLVAAGWLLRVGKFRWQPMLSTGFVIGIVPAAMWQHPWAQSGSQSSFWVGGVQTIDNGVLTLAGWFNFFQFIGCAGALGAMGAMAFFIVYKGVSPNYVVKRTAQGALRVS